MDADQENQVVHRGGAENDRVIGKKRGIHDKGRLACPRPKCGEEFGAVVKAGTSRAICRRTGRKDTEEL